MPVKQRQFEFGLEPALAQNQTPDTTADMGLKDQWRAFHAANPHVYRAIVSVTRELKQQGWRRAGMKQIFEHLRWRYAMSTRGEQWKLNNNYTAYYARQVMRLEPDLAGFFNIRDQKDG
jgi:hypothetical protein